MRDSITRLERGAGVNAGVACGLGGADGVGRGAGVGARGVGNDTAMGSHQLILTVSTRQPSPEPLLSLAMRQRNLVLIPGNNGRFTTVVMKPPEFGLKLPSSTPIGISHHAIGLPRSE